MLVVWADGDIVGAFRHQTLTGAEWARSGNRRYKIGWIDPTKLEDWARVKPDPDEPTVIWSERGDFSDTAHTAHF